MYKKQRYKTHLHDSEKGYDKYASSYDKKSDFLNSFERGAIESLADDLTGKTILDVGAGTGRVFDLLKQRGTLKNAKEIHALDVSKNMLGILKGKHPQAVIAHGDMCAMPYKDGTFDLVIAAFAIVHLKSLDKFFDEVYRVLKPGGIFILTNINQKKAPKLWTEQGEKLIVESYYNLPEHVIKSLQKAFFKIEVEEFIEDGGMWINQVIKTAKSL